MMTPQEALNKAKIALMSRDNSVFFTTILFSLKHEWNDKIPTARVSSTTLQINPDFFMSLDAEERVFLLVHECMHPALLHTIRLGTRNHQKFNIAGDHVINLMLIERGFKMPKIGLADRQFKGMSTEEVYDLLPDLPESFSYDCDISADSDANGLSEAEQEAELQDIIVRASIQSQMGGDDPGTIPGEIQIFLDRLLKHKLPWHRILRRYMQASAKTDFTFQKPNRRFFPDNYLPSLSGEGLIDIAVAIDTSGSVSDEDFQVFVSEMASILKMHKPETLTLLHFDTRIKSIDRLQSMKDLSKVEFTGRGGTCITPVLDWANTNKPKLLLVFTDGFFDFYGMETKVNTVWLINDNPDFTSKFGKVIHYDIH